MLSTAAGADPKKVINEDMSVTLHEELLTKIKALGDIDGFESNEKLQADALKMVDFIVQPWSGPRQYDIKVTMQRRAVLLEGKDDFDWYTRHVDRRLAHVFKNQLVDTFQAENEGLFAKFFTEWFDTYKMSSQNDFAKRLKKEQWDWFKKWLSTHAE